jgi:transcriptional regulator with XRE-family HTH domain
MSQAALAAAVGVSFQQVQKYECGFNRMSVGMLLRVASALKVPPAQLIDGLSP